MPVIDYATEAERLIVMKFPVIIALGLASVLVCSAEAVKDREGAVRNDRATMENDSRWIYNDVDKGFEQAKASGKPLLVVLRCVPCLSCAGIDASVLQEPELKPLLDQFVCVRIINANALDLTLFQFDYDLSFSTLFFNADRTIYGRFGSWTHQKNSTEKTLSGYKAALEGALALHRGYPGNRAALAGKQGESLPFKRVLDVPGLAGKYKLDLDWRGRVVPSCVHCHQIGEGFRSAHWERKEPVPGKLIYPQPVPETVGLTLTHDRAAFVSAVAGDSPAGHAGFRAGDEILSLSGQPLLSVADVSWVLHRAPDAGTNLTAMVKRGGATETLTLNLPSGWRGESDISRRVGTWQMRGLVTGGLKLQDLPDPDRNSRGLKEGSMALLVEHVGEYGQHAAAKRAGFRKGDVIVAVAELSERMSEGELIGALMQSHRKGQTVPVQVLRGTQSVQLSLPMQ